MDTGVLMRGRGARVRGYVVTLGAVLVSLAAAAVLQPFVGLENVDLVLLTSVVAAAAAYGLGPSIVAALASVLVYTFFFIPPTFTFEVADPKNLTALALFIIVALITGNLAARVRIEAVAASLQAQNTEALYAFSHSIADLSSRDELVEVAVRACCRLN